MMLGEELKTCQDLKNKECIVKVVERSKFDGRNHALFYRSAVTMLGEELKNPGRDMPRSIVFGMLTVIFIYVTANVAYLCILPADSKSPTPGNLAVVTVKFACLCILLADNEFLASDDLTTSLLKLLVYVSSLLIVSP